MTFMYVADGMLQVRQIIAADEDEIGMDWQVWDLAPIPLTERGTSEAAKALICTFPAYSLTDQAETAFEQMIQEILQTEVYVTERWLIGRQTDGDWLMLINQEEVCTLQAEYISETWPTEHEWEENVWDDWEEES